MSQITDSLVVLGEGARFAALTLQRRGKGYKRYKGSPLKICEQIVKECFNGTYFQGSCGHFSSFWVRDLGMCAESFMRIGFKDELCSTLEWALAVYEKNNKVTTTIFKHKYPVDIYAYASDSLPFLLWACIAAEREDLLKKHKDFLNGEINRYAQVLFDFKNGMIKRKLYVSGAKDCVLRDSSMYDNTMAAWLKNLLKRCSFLDNPWKNADIKANLKENLWNGNYFLEDLSGVKYVSADANIWPYWCGVFKEKELFQSSIDTIIQEMLDQPLPLKYHAKRHPEREFHIPKIFTPNYQGDTIWTQIGMIYIMLVKKLYPSLAMQYLGAYTKLIKHYGNYLELFVDKNASDEIPPVPYTGRFGIYTADEGMIWAAMYVDLAYQGGDS